MVQTIAQTLRVSEIALSGLTETNPAFLEQSSLACLVGNLQNFSNLAPGLRKQEVVIAHSQCGVLRTDQESEVADLRLVRSALDVDCY